VCENVFDFSFEAQATTKEILKDMLWDELSAFVPRVFSKMSSNTDSMGCA
jgi:hypothetical protein